MTTGRHVNKTEKSKEFFNNPDNYITANVIIELRQKIISDLLGHKINKNILDLGCGNGDLTRCFVYGNKITYLDISPNMIKLVKDKIPNDCISNCTFINSNFSEFQTNAKFDIIICVGVFAHIENILELLQKIKEISCLDAEIIIQYTSSEKLISKFNSLRSALSKKNNSNYKTNSTTNDYILKLLKKENWSILKEVKYIPISPLLSLFTYRRKLKILTYYLNSYFFKKFGSEVILHLKKVS